MTTGYSETLLEHARHPHNLGVDENATNLGKANLGGSPPAIEFFLRIREGRIESARFQAVGCGVAIACGSALTDLVQGITVEEAKAVDKPTLVETLNGIPVHKLYCLEVALAALRDALT